MTSAFKFVGLLVHSIRRSSLFFGAILLLALIGLPSRSFAQNATIVGTVSDPTGAAIPNVTVAITNTDTGKTVTIPTNDAGQYVAPDLPVGHYTVKATASGFKVTDRQGIVLNVGDRLRVDFSMTVGAKTESITVEANPIAVQSDTGEVSSLVNSKQITELATNGRTIYSYVVLTPGATGLTPDSQLPVPTGGNGSISFNGNRPTHNLYLLDGGENADRGGSSANSSVMPSMDAVAETQILTSNYSAEYGLSSGGTLSSVVKSGTQTIHASAWEFFRNDALDARGFFNPAPQPVAELRYNIYGFNVGGPVTFGKLYNPSKTKTFFFYNMEWRKIIQGGSPINTKVPDPTTYGGDFSENLPANLTLADKTTVVPNSGLHVPCANQLSSTQVTAFQTAGITQFSTPGADGDCAVHPSEPLASQPTFVAFPGNAIPSGPTGLLNSFAQSLLTAGGKYGGIFPAPTNSSGFFNLPVSSPTDVREEIVRIDQNFTDKFTVYGHFVAEQIAQNFATSMWSGDNVPSVGNTFGNPSYAGVVHSAYTISPTLVNEISFNYNGNRIAITPVGLYTSPSEYGRFFNVSGQNADNRIPSISLGGTTGTDYTVNWMPWNNVADSYQIRDDVSWTKGRHQFKMGGGWMLYKKTQDWFKNTQGNYTFNGSFTGNDFADYLLGYANNYTEDALKEAGQWNNVSWNLYFQDNWRVNNRLTLNLGLRWDGIPHTYEASNQMANFYPNLYNPATPATLLPGNNTIDPASQGLGPSPTVPGQDFYVNGIAQCGVAGVPKGCVDNAWLNFQPRLGFAYDLKGDGKTVIRGGYGIMNERVQGNDVYNNAGTVPLAASVNFSNVMLSNPSCNVVNGSGCTGGAVASIPVNNVTGLDKSNYASPRSTQFSLGVQQAIGKSVLSLAYVGTQNRHQNYYTETNLPAYSDLANLQANPAEYNAAVQYVGFDGIKMSRNEANSDYNGLQVSMRGTWLSSDLTYQVGYTYSHTNDSFNSGASGGDLYNVSDPYLGWKYDFGPSAFDKRNVFFINFVYDLPLMKHSDNKFAKAMLGGWEISGIVTASSGAPINIGLSGPNVTSIVPNSFNRPDQTGTPHDPHTVAEWFDTSVYTTPAAGTWGDTPRNSVRGPGRDNWNVSFFKNFVLSETRGSNLQFRAEFFNLWNHTQLQADTFLNGSNGNDGGIGGNLNGANFGQITSAYDPRIVQLALKLYF
jgi:Carboxypeptidase regulatory-like domain